MSKWIDNILTAFFIFTFVTIIPVTYVVVNVTTRPDTIMVAIDLPPDPRKGVIEIWEPIEHGGDLGPPPAWYVDYEYESSFAVDAPNSHYNLRAYTPEEHACMAQNIYFEARNESKIGQIAVALVTLERVEDPRYPNDVCAVVYDNQQFSWYWDGLPDRPKNMKKYEEIALLVSAVMDPDTMMYDYTYGSTHYHADYVEPYWKDYMVFKAKIDTHLFYYEPPQTLTASL